MNFYTNHARVLSYLTANPETTGRQASIALDLTERAIRQVIIELQAGGYVSKKKGGRKNSYTILKPMPPLGKTQEVAQSKHEALHDALASVAKPLPKEKS